MSGALYLGGVMTGTRLEDAMFLSHVRQPKVNISHARTVVAPRFSN